MIVIDTNVAFELMKPSPDYPMIVTRRDRAGLPIDGFDAQIASICHTHDAALATRNLKDFQNTGIDVIDPWQAA